MKKVLNKAGMKEKMYEGYTQVDKDFNALVSKMKANAIDVVNAVLAKVRTVRGSLLPADVSIAITRDYGHTAAEKSNELLWHMGLAVFGVAHPATQVHGGRAGAGGR